MYKQAWDKILNAKSIVIASHIHPDGDTIGSSLCLYNILQELGKRVSLYNATKDELPREFDFLEGYTKIRDKLPKFFDLIISCDSASFNRVKIEKNETTLMNIDHHKSNTNFGDINVVLEDASSSGMVVYKLLKANDIKISKKSAIALYTSIAEDTDFFRYGGIDDTTFDAASDLIKCGVNPEEISAKVKSRKSLAKTRLIAYMLSNFALHVDGQVASIIFDKKVLEQTGAKRPDTKNIVSMLNDIVNVKVAVMVLEEEQSCKVSLRSDGDIDVSEISALYSGGGHKSAAGFSVQSLDLSFTCKEIVQRIEKKLLK